MMRHGRLVGSRAGVRPGTTVTPAVLRGPQVDVIELGITPDWKVRAKCRTADRELFFAPDREREPDRTVRIKAAKAICRTCPVLVDCLRWALEVGEQGVWGCTTEDERESAKLKAARSARRAKAAA